MAHFEVELYPVMLLRIAEVEAGHTGAAIQAAMAVAQARCLAPTGDGGQRPVFASEYARYVVTPLVDGHPDRANSETFLDAAFINADQRDVQDGFPMYDSGASASD